MKVEKQYLEDHTLKLTVEVDSKPWEKAKYLAARHLSKQVEIPGFRPGKAPYNVIVRHIGESHIIDHALEELVDDIYPQLIEEQEIDPYGPGSLEEVVDLDPLLLEFIVPLRPQVELGDYKALELPYEPPAVEDKDVEEVLNELRDRHSETKSFNQPAKEGDIVFMRVSAKRMDMEDEQEATLFDQQFSSAKLGQSESATDRQFFAGFSKHLEGMAPDDRKTLTHTYAQDYDDEDLRGAEVEFTVQVTNVQSQTFPELNDDFAKTASEFDSIEEWRRAIRAELEEDHAKQYDNEYEDEIIHKLIAESTVKYPPQVIEDEKETLRDNLERQLDQQGIGLEDYLEIREIDDDEFDEELTEAAEDNVKQTLVLHQVAETEEIEPDPNEISAATDRTLNLLNKNMTPQEMRDLRQGGRLDNVASNITLEMTLRRTAQYLAAIAKGEPFPEVEDPA